MSALLDDLIQQRRNETLAYEEFLERAEALVKRLARKQPAAGIPAILHGKPEAIVLFNNLASIQPASASAMMRICLSPLNTVPARRHGTGFPPRRLRETATGALWAAREL